MAIENAKEKRLRITVISSVPDGVKFLYNEFVNGAKGTKTETAISADGNVMYITGADFEIEEILSDIGTSIYGLTSHVMGASVRIEEYNPLVYEEAAI